MNKISILIVLSTLPFVSQVQALTLFKEPHIDLTSDRFDVIEEVGRRYVKSYFKNVDYTLKPPFGLSYKSNSGNKFPKTGFIGFEVWSKGLLNLLKLQLFKDKYGWHVDRVLPNNQINEAHPLKLPLVGHARTDEALKVQQASALKFEKYATEQEIISDVRSTSSNCYLTKNLESASCTITYGIRYKHDENSQECMTVSYLMKKEGGVWSYHQKISANQQVDYSTGLLKEKKIYPPHCN